MYYFTATLPFHDTTYSDRTEKINTRISAVFPGLDTFWWQAQNDDLLFKKYFDNKPSYNR